MSTDRQLALIAEITAIARHRGIDVWLRGGWAVDFYLGRVTREHVDVDFFTWSREVERLDAALTDHGYEPLTGAPADQQRDFTKDGEEVSFALLETADDGRPLVGGGLWRGEPFPEATEHEVPGRIGDIECPVVSPEGQITTKLMTPVWIPDRPRRAKDAADIALLRAALDGVQRDARSG